jgi:tRNA pseudouridine13 synthase
LNVCGSILSVNISDLEKSIGLEFYFTKSLGIGGKIRVFFKDFIVEEVMLNHKKASINTTMESAIHSGYGRYLISILIKKGWDTFSAIREISRKLNVDKNKISIGGIKDTRALTAQFISTWGISIKKILSLDVKNLNLIPLRYESQKIDSSSMLGNQFKIKIRFIEQKYIIVYKRVTEIKNSLIKIGGIPNFFGHQRFGTVRAITHKIGRCFVKGDFEEAALIFLSESSVYENQYIKIIREELQKTGDFSKYLSLIPRKFYYERILAKSLSKHPRDFIGAFNKVPLELLRFFVHSYQSFLFNKFLSERMKKNIPINKIQVGDYVVNLDENGLPGNKFKKILKIDESINKQINEGKIAISLPLIGYEQNISGGLQGEIEHKVLESENIEPEDFNIEKINVAKSKGKLRPIISPVKKLKIKIDKNDFKIQNDVFPEKINLTLDFGLNKGSYATILLREFIKPKDTVKTGF